MSNALHHQIWVLEKRIEALQSQRNNALDACVVLKSQVATLEAAYELLEKKLAELEEKVNGTDQRGD